MSGLYVQMDADLDSTPRLLATARDLGIDDAAVEGYLRRVWTVWLRQHTAGLVRWDDLADLEPLVRWRGESGALARALLARGWVVDTGEGYRVLGWDRYEAMEERREREKVRSARRRRSAPSSDSGDLQTGKRSTEQRPSNDRRSTAGRHAVDRAGEGEGEGDREGTTEETTSLLARSSGEPDSAPPQIELVPQPVALGDWPCRGGSTWDLTEAHARELAETYSTEVSAIVAQARQARQWLRDDPRRQKTHGGMRRFLSGWLTKAANRGQLERHPSGPPRPRGGGERMRVQDELRLEEQALLAYAERARAREAAGGWEEAYHAA